jgi:hypothetical protein
MPRGKPPVEQYVPEIPNLFDDEVEDLKRTNEQLGQEVMSLMGDMTAGMFALIAAFVLCVRVLLRFYEPKAYKLYFDIGFAALALALFVMWIKEGRKQLGWMIVPNLILVFDCAVAAVFYPAGIYAAILGLLLIPTKTVELALAKLLARLEGLYDKRRKTK